ncbi:class I SAM-dependent methyltransferase [Rhodobacteraceae bacterium NNCM2]|nr:class I SAM-dependent methyltransferase [Coraliihabitans acroporae]
MRHFKALGPGKILEIGCGAGTLLDDLASMGFHGVGVDRSRKALKLANEVHGRNSPIQIRRETDRRDCGSFDYVCSFEVLEHIEDDAGTLREWAEFVGKDGYLLLSVPAHPERWSAADEWGGHVRRYRRAELHDLVTNAGFKVETIQTYGFPLGNVMDRLSVRVYERQANSKQKSSLDSDERTDESGADRLLLTRLWPFYSFSLSVMVLEMFCQIQRLFLNTDLGNGYIVVARKVG